MTGECINCEAEIKAGCAYYCDPCNVALTRIREKQGWATGKTADEHHADRAGRDTGVEPPKGQKFNVTMCRSAPSAFVPESYLITMRVEISARYARQLIERADTENDFCTMVDAALKERFNEPLDKDEM